MNYNKRVAAIAPSMTLGIAGKAKAMKAEGISVVNFSAGEPDFDTPEFIKEACKKALDQGKTKYAPDGGIPELKNAILEKLKKENGLTYTAEEVFVTVGAKEALFDMIMTVIDEGDEVLIPVPYWVSYEEMVRAAGGKSVFIPTSLSQGYKVTVADVKKYVTPKTKAFLLNSPSNPSGVVYSPEELKALAEYFAAQNIWVISDEIYEKILYGKATHASIASFAGMKEKTIVINGFSKSHSMTGWRLGYAAGPKQAITYAKRLQGHANSGAATFLQYAAVEGLKDTSFIESMRKEFEKRKEVIVKGLNQIQGIRCPEPDGAFYVFPDVSALFGKTLGGKVMKGSMDVSEVLLEVSHVATVPGIAFGMDQNIRLSFATSLSDIEEGLKRIKKLVEG
jgi:aspartate aminotransferase